MTLAALLGAPSPAHAATTAAFLIDSSTGPVLYSACAGPITWTLRASGITESRSSIERETVLWTEAFEEIESLSPYEFTFIATTDPTDAVLGSREVGGEVDVDIVIDYSTGTTTHALGHGGITETVWNDTHWAADRSIVTLNAGALRAWERDPRMRSWLVRHELGHALGLGHSDDVTHLMAHRYHPRVSPVRYRASDLAIISDVAGARCSAAGH